MVLIPLPRDNLSAMNERAPGEKLFWSVPMHYVHPRLKGFHRTPPALLILPFLPSFLSLHGTVRLSVPGLFSPPLVSLLASVPGPSLSTPPPPLVRYRTFWDICTQELHFVPMEVRDQLRSLCLCVDDVDAAWDRWSQEAEAGLLRAYQAAGGALSSVAQQASLDGRRVSIRTRRLGGRCKCRIYRTDHSDPIDAASAGFIIHFSLALVLLFRRRMKSVSNVNGMRNR